MLNFEPIAPKIDNKIMYLIKGWVNSKKAKLFPEGSVVLRRITNRHIQNYNSLTIEIYFRPDWVENESGYGCSKYIKYLLICKK